MNPEKRRNHESSLIHKKIAMKCTVELTSLTRTVGGRVKADIRFKGVDYVQLFWKDKSKIVDFEED